jgi:hypothetical protein
MRTLCLVAILAAMEAPLAMASTPLEARFDLPQKARLGPNRSLTLSINFKNPGPEKVRIYFLEKAEAFRLFQSTFRLLSADRKKVLFVWPEPHPHGYRVGANDFHLIDPGESVSFDQAIYFQEAPGKVPPEAASGDFILEWSYENQTKTWQAGIQTMDGPTADLFPPRGDIPFIWTGKIIQEMRIHLGADGVVAATK